MRNPPLPPRCPSCSNLLVVTRLVCPSCASEVAGEFDPCPACTLEGEQRRIFDAFLSSRGNLREVQRVLGVSYPTARLRMEEVFRSLEQAWERERPEPMSILTRLRSGDIDLDEALRLLEGDA